MRILFIAEPYIDRLFFDFFAQNFLHQFIVLKENHPEVFENEYDNICFCNLEEALNKSDSIIIFSSKNLPQKLIDRCYNHAKNTGKTIFYEFLDDREDIDSVKSYIVDLLSTVMPEKPCVLLLQVGQKTQIERVELSLCASLNENGIKYFFSSNSIINKIRDLPVFLNFLNPFRYSIEESKIMIISIKIGIENLLGSNISGSFFDQFMQTLKPDYIVMTCENDYELKEKLSDIFEIKYSRAIDLFVASEYLSLKHDKKDNITLLIDKKSAIDLFEDIKNKLSFPIGVKELHFDQ